MHKTTAMERRIGSSPAAIEAATRRLLKHVSQTEGCWWWTGKAQTHHGYGKLNFERVVIRAHRLSYIVHKGSIPDGLQVMHSCDNPECVNPAHLSVGTSKDNSEDMYAKGRACPPPKFARANHPMAKLSASDIEGIKASAGTAAMVAARLGICTKTVYRARRGELDPVAAA